jgi:hypothetical protein
MVDQAHPDYHEGFFDGLDGDPMPAEASPEYQEGWNAAHRSKLILKDAGFSHNGHSFSAVGAITHDADDLANKLADHTPKLSGDVP